MLTVKLTVVSEDLSVLRNKHVLIVEDIIDTGGWVGGPDCLNYSSPGNTLTKFCAWLKVGGGFKFRFYYSIFSGQEIQPKSIGVASLVEKR